jgi:hypothetical protein
MDDYLGVVVRESLQVPSLTPPVIASKRSDRRTLLLVRIPAEELHREVEMVRSNLDRTDCWYSHFFRDDELVVVFDDEVFWVSTDPAAWGSALQHGRDRGVPGDQLDFPSKNGRSSRRGVLVCGSISCDRNGMEWPTPCP